MEKSTELLFRIIRLLLKPVIRFCVSNNIRLQEFEEVAKLAFIDVAEENLKEQGKEISQSRLSVITGLHRRDINRLYVQKEEPKLSHSVLTRVIGKWRNSASYSVAASSSSRSATKRVPKVLSCDGKESEFFKLVGSVSLEANPYAVLLELERIGLVVRTPSGLKLGADGFVPRGDSEQGLLLLARDASDLVAGVSENILEEISPPNLHLSTEFDNISPAHAQKIKLWFLEEGAKFHARATQFLMKFDRDVRRESRKEDSGRVRAVIGTFSRVQALERESSRVTEE